VWIDVLLAAQLIDGAQLGGVAHDDVPLGDEVSSPSPSWAITHD
jgi:hypothetical protein